MRGQYAYVLFNYHFPFFKGNERKLGGSGRGDLFTAKVNVKNEKNRRLTRILSVFLSVRTVHLQKCSGANQTTLIVLRFYDSCCNVGLRVCYFQFDPLIRNFFHQFELLLQFRAELNKSQSQATKEMKTKNKG